MATVNELDAATVASTTDGATRVSNSFNPSSGSLLVVSVVASGTADAGEVTASANGVSTFTRVDRATFNTSLNSTYIFIADQLTTGTAAMTVTFDATGDNHTGAIVMVCEVTGMTKTGADAILQSAKTDNGAGGGTPAVTFGASCLTGNVTIVALGQISSNGSAEPTSWTEGADVTYSTPTIGGTYVYRNSGFTGTTITWGATETAHGMVAVELDTSADGVTGAGAVTAAPATADAAGSLSLTGSGAGTAPAATTDAAGDLSLTGSGTVTAPAATAAGAGDLSLTGEGAVIAPIAIASGAGDVEEPETVTGSGAVTGPAATAAGAGTLSLTGAGDVTAPGARVDINGSVTEIVVVTGTAAVTGPPATIDATGTVPSLVFEPPTFEAPIRTTVRPLNYYSLTYGVSVVRVNGSFTSVRVPTSKQLRDAGEEGTDFFRGGHIYTVTKAIADELTLAGYVVTES